jgi:hypothetical protein
MKKLVLFTILLLLISNLQAAFDLQFVVTRNDQSNGGQFQVMTQIRSSSGSFNIGNSNLVFNYNTSGLSSPTLVQAHNFNSAPYTIAMTVPTTGTVSINISYFSSFGAALTVGTTWVNVATIGFTIDDQTTTSNLQWDTAAPNDTQVKEDDNTTNVAIGTLSPKDVSLPVEFYAYEARAEQGQVLLTWITESELENQGFDIYRSISVNGDYVKINGQRIRGAGTSSERHEYSYVDDRIDQDGNYYYKIADVDLNGRTRLHGPVSVFVEAVQIPEEMILEQNYPNPFNPDTKIQFGLTGESRVKLQIYNLRGELIRTLVDGNRAAGYHDITWDGTSDAGIIMPTGVYIYRLQTDNFVDTKKMVRTK